jgi:peptidase A4-like protein
MQQVKRVKVCFPVLTLLVMVLCIAGQQHLIARADAGCSNGSCQRAGYVAQGGSGTYKYVESTFILPKNQDIITGKNGQFSLGVGLDSNSGSPRWASAGVNMQVTNGRIASPTAFWSVTNGANIRDPRGQGPGHGFFRSTVQVQLGDKIFASVQLQSQGQIRFTMENKTRGGRDRFTLNLDDSSKQPDGSMAGCFLFFSISNGPQALNGLSYPREARFFGCKVGANQGSTQTIDKVNPAVYAVSGLSNTPTLTSPPTGGKFTVNWDGIA